MAFRPRWWAASFLAAWLVAPVSQARLDWAAFEQYQPAAQLLRFNTAGASTAGTLMIWPEQGQTHYWLPMATYWQQRGWDFIVLQPDPAQQSFNPASEQPTAQQRQWQEQTATRLSGVLAGLESSPPLLVVAQGSAALWYQQLVDSTALPPPQALVLLDALPVPAAEQQMLAMSLARSPYPVLDIYSRPDSPLAWHNQRRRRQQLGSRGKTDYLVQHFAAPGMLEKQMASWLIRLGWLPLPPSAPDYLKEQLKEQRHETGISGSQNPGTGDNTARPGLRAPLANP
ncbi:DUF3530 family protein [uncultured Oceanisphaera sp.]|uniref:DUF3530 family protein n=1 Tax=uncultured Oceanisphaera sp. TaxID=353858 RepID=UPI002615C630|nr:DUF3530 family protein [uncultured Oceanisphaera sp.]